MLIPKLEVCLDALVNLCADRVSTCARALPPEEGGVHDKGRECALALVQLMNTLEALEGGQPQAGA